MATLNRVSDVFRSTGQPTVTYVQRESGILERRLNSYLDEAGQLCLITGPSKTGKTTLYKQVLAERGDVPLVVQCTKSKSALDIWKEALENVNFDRVTSSTMSTGNQSKVAAEVAAEGGWAWLAKITGKFGLEREDSFSESEIRERVLADPSPDTLIPLLKHTPYVLVIEDFHYLDDKDKVLLFQQWKRFIDSEITIIVLGTAHRAVDIANSNKDLVGRIAQIDVSQWAVEDLEKICRSGFEYLKAEASAATISLISMESVGLPIIVQQVCLELFNTKNIYSISDARKRRLKIDRSGAKSAFYEVAKNRYTSFESYYATLIRGPREKQRVYKTYELVLACFTVDPIMFDLTRAEIDRRLIKLVAETANTTSRPPQASINSTLGALSKFQDRRGFQLLEWRPSEDKLYIVEPAFLFYVRWRKVRTEGEQLDLFEMLLMTQKFAYLPPLQLNKIAWSEDIE